MSGPDPEFAGEEAANLRVQSSIAYPPISEQPIWSPSPDSATDLTGLVHRGVLRVHRRDSRGLVQPSTSQRDSRPRGLGVSLVLPAYNEEARIASTLSRYLPVLESSNLPFEILVVADGTDGTPLVAQKLGRTDVHVIVSDRKLGKGGAILEGFRRSRYQITGYVDADGSLLPDDLSRLVRLAGQEGRLCVIGSRWAKGSRWVRREPFAKRLASRVFNGLVRGLLSIPVADSQCGAKFYSGAVLDEILPRISVTNLTTDVDFLFHARRAGASILEVPVTWDDDPRSRFTLTSMIPIMFLTVVGIRLMNLPLRRRVPPDLVRNLQKLVGAI